MDEVRRATATQDSSRARRARRVEAHGDELFERHAGAVGGDREPRLDLSEAGVRPVHAAGRVLAEPLDEELPSLVEERVVDRRAAQVDAGDEFFRW